MINRQKPPAWSVIKAKLKPWGRDENSLLVVFEQFVHTLFTNLEGRKWYALLRQRCLALAQDTQIIGWGFGDRVGDLVKGLDQLLGGGAETRANAWETASRTSGAATKDASSAP